MPRRDQVADQERALYVRIALIVAVIIVILIIGFWSMGQTPD